MAKSFAPSWDRNPPEIFWPILLDQVIGEGHAGIGQEAQHVLFADAEAQYEVMAYPSRRTATAPGFCQCWLYFLERQAFCQDGVVMALDQRDQTGVRSAACPAREQGSSRGRRGQQALHPACLVFLLDLDQRLQFPLMVGIAQRVQHAGHRVVRE